MTQPHSHESHRPERPAEVAQGGASASRGEAGQGDAPDTRPLANAEAALGGADAVQKTSYGVAHGTEPVGASSGDTTSHPRPGGGPNFLAWGIGAVVAVVAIIYLMGMVA